LDILQNKAAVSFNGTAAFISRIELLKYSLIRKDVPVLVALLQV